MRVFSFFFEIEGIVVLNEICFKELLVFIVNEYFGLKDSFIII